MPDEDYVPPRGADSSRWLYWIALGVGIAFAGLYALGACAIGAIC